MDKQTLLRILPSAPVTRLDAYMPLLNEALTLASCNTPARVAMFLAQFSVETRSMNAFEENLSYSADALLSMWPNRYTLDLAHAHAHKPELIANHVYANRMGNGDEASGDGWRYRGRGLPMFTGLTWYQRFAKAMGFDFVGKPELVAQPQYAFVAGSYQWNEDGMNAFADKKDIIGGTKKINGGLNGLTMRQATYKTACVVLGA